MLSLQHIQYINDNGLKAYFESSLSSDGVYTDDIINAMESGYIHMKDNMEVKDTNGNTAIAYTVSEGPYDAVSKLIDTGADVNAVDSDGFAPLALAVSRAKYAEEDKEQSLDIVKQLLEVEGIDMNHTPEGEDSALTIATQVHNVTSSHEELTKMLLDAGADVNVQDGNGKTPLMLAAVMTSLTQEEYDIREALVTLLSKAPGIDFYVKDNSGNTVINLVGKQFKETGENDLALKMFKHVMTVIDNEDNEDDEEIDAIIPVVDTPVVDIPVVDIPATSGEEEEKEEEEEPPRGGKRRRKGKKTLKKRKNVRKNTNKGKKSKKNISKKSHKKRMAAKKSKKSKKNVKKYGKQRK